MEGLMFDKNYSLAVEIKNLILSFFYYADIDIVYDNDLDEYFITTRDEKLYYSEAYGMLVLAINQGILWKYGNFNFYFILDNKPARQKNTVEKISFEQKEAGSYFSWGVYNTDNMRIEGGAEFSDYYLVA
jgi:hypothetical protein